jgi:hypothetical protein
MIQQYLGISPDKLIKAGWETLYGCCCFVET